MGKLLLVVSLLSLGVGCYGRASPDSCHAKYVRDGRGKGEDNYENCLARAEKLRLHQRATARGEYTGPSKFERYAPLAAVVVSSAIVSRHGRQYTCTTWSSGAVTCQPY